MLKNLPLLGEKAMPNVEDTKKRTTYTKTKTYEQKNTKKGTGKTDAHKRKPK